MAHRAFNYKDYLYLDKEISNKLFNYGWNDCKNLLSINKNITNLM